MPDPSPTIDFFSTSHSSLVSFGSNITASGSGIYDVARATPDFFTEYEAYNTPNWDGYTAEPITRETIDAARRFNSILPRSLPSADIAPGPDGTIGFEWRFGPMESRRFLFVDVGPGNLITARRIDDDGNIHRFEPITVNAQRVLHLISRLFPSSVNAQSE